MCNYRGRVAFDALGNMVEYITWKMRVTFDGNTWFENDSMCSKILSGSITARDNFIFKDNLIVLRMTENRLYVKSINNGREYSIFKSDIPKFVLLASNGVISGYFTFRKHGERIGLIPAVFAYEDYTTND